ncbi:hypothetical protein [Streptomyces litchfieldiae]|uniref:Large membrane protein n=1 Tax=Streptomyces litchfieldiae TaxID=3075543 RepID=A0ABU2MTM6_9ACTN|nr:hypothetical protein [Streptomyces sp. DSM 44938]MDT0344668.1 hypothetical protein [Streptomyces sp. DSM 44938]
MADEETRDGAAPPESPQDEPGRRRWPAVTAVAVAVAVIGGGLYGARALTEDDSPDGDPPGETAPLVLDGEGTLELGVAGGAEADLAMGWPGPTTLRLTGDPGAPPELAPVYYAGELPEERAEELSAALGLDGELTPSADGVWTVSGADGRVLTVLSDGPAQGYWIWGGGEFTALVEEAPGAEAGAGSAADPNAAVSSDGMGTPPGEDEALAAAEPLLDSLGLADAVVDAGRTSGAERIVRASPTVDGLPVHGLETEVFVGADGEVTWASGTLNTFETNESRGTLSAQDAVAAYNEAAGPMPVPAIMCGPAASAEPVPHAEGGGAEPDCGGLDEKPAPVSVTAEFGLALHSSEEEPVLVPSWLFSGTLESGEPFTDSGPAVAHEFAGAADDGSEPGDTATGEPAQPEQPEQPEEQSPVPADPGESPEISETGWSVEPYEESDETLTLWFWGGVCGRHEATAEESAGEVRVRLDVVDSDPELECIALAEEQSAQVRLSEPVGDRTLLDERGEPVPVR